MTMTVGELRDWLADYDADQEVVLATPRSSDQFDVTAIETVTTEYGHDPLFVVGKTGGWKQHLPGIGGFARYKHLLRSGATHAAALKHAKHAGRST